MYMSDFKIVGKLAGVKEKNRYYMVSIAENIYSSDGIKTNTIWYNCICAYKPKATVGDTVIAVGSFVASKNEKFPYALEITHIGVMS